MVISAHFALQCENKNFEQEQSKMENQVWVKVSLFLKEFGQCQFHAQENNILPDQILIVLESLSVLIFLCNLYNPLEDMSVPIFF